ncbi:MAG TPA: diguanylate cyclase, partial [Myxococcaceae bacterium]|nr:diguanylate cyclase [Myxococcaceae bacterium]
MRAIPGLAIALAFAHLLRGGFTGFAQLGWWEVGLTAFLLLGIGLSSARELRRIGTGARALFRDEVELGGGLIAAGYLLVAMGGPALFPIVYLLMAFLVSFFPRRVGLTLLGVALIFDAATTLILTGPSWTGLLPHAAFLILFAALYHLVLTARLATAKKAERQAVQRRVAEVEEQARTFRLVSSGTQHNLADTKGHEKWL